MVESWYLWKIHFLNLSDLQALRLIDLHGFQGPEVGDMVWCLLSEVTDVSIHRCWRLAAYWLAGWLAAWLAGWLLAAEWEDDEEEGFGGPRRRVWGLLCHRFID